MIDNQHDQKGEVLIQWISGSRRDLHKDFQGTVVGPDEYLVLIKNGEIEDVVTQRQIDLDPGRLRRFLEWVGGNSPEVSIAIVSTRKHELSIPFEAYSHDRVCIRGAVNLFANISKDSVELSIRLLRETGQYNREHLKDGILEFRLDDLKTLIGRNTAYVIDTEAISAYNASEIQANRVGMCTDIISALNSKTPYWANYGLSVNYSSVDIGDNEYERLERLERENQLRQRQRDIDYAEAGGLSEQLIRLEDIKERQQAALDFNRYISKIDLQASIIAHDAENEHEAAMRVLGFDEDEKTREAEKNNRLELMGIYHLQEKARVLADTEMSDHEKDVRIAEIDQRLDQIRIQVSKAQFDFESYMKDTEARREREQRQFETTLELDRKAREAEILLKLSEREDNLREKRQDHSHEETMATIDADVRKTAYANDGDRLRAEAEAKAARAELTGFKDANAVSHQQNMDSMTMTERMIYAASGREKIEDKQILCPKCGMRLDPRAKFCISCGCKLQED